MPRSWVGLRTVTILALAGICIGASSVPDEPWASTDIGAVGPEGGAQKDGGIWTVSGAGGDVWGNEDAFQYLHTLAFDVGGYVTVRVNDFEAADPFAKAGLMVRASLAPNAATVVLSTKPNNEIEFMHRPTAGAEMTYDGGTFVSLPAWLRLDTSLTDSSSAGLTYTVAATVSQDGARWTRVGPLVTILVPCCNTMEAGAIVTSHDTSTLGTAHFEGLSSLANTMTSTDIGQTNLRGSAVLGPSIGSRFTVEGAGGDIWGDADSFQFVHSLILGDFQFNWNVRSIEDTDPFAKAGLMIRNGLTPDAENVILDMKPNNEIEFMARLCTGCFTQYLGGTTITPPAELILVREGSTFTAYVAPQSDFAHRREVGSVVIPMAPRVEHGVVVTSHDPNRLATAVFTDTAR